MKLKEWGYLRHNTQRRSAQFRGSREESTATEATGRDDTESDGTATAVGNISVVASEERYVFVNLEKMFTDLATARYLPLTLCRLPGT